MNSDETGPVNIGNPSEFRVLELAQRVIQLTNSSSSIIHKPLPLDDPKQRRPDIEKARKSLNWEPLIPLEEGLKSTISYFEKCLQTSGGTLQKAFK
jgi:UDP-glucuronate decarboxylase